jgi:hypothetical protein
MHPNKVMEDGEAAAIEAVADMDADTEAAAEDADMEDAAEDVDIKCSSNRRRRTILMQDFIKHLRLQ